METTGLTGYVFIVHCSSTNHEPRTTNYFCCYACDLNVIGIRLECARIVEVIKLIENDLYLNRLLKPLNDADGSYSYYGSSFDRPFIEAKLGIDLDGLDRHNDLMYHCWKKNLKGWFKVVERILGIDRKIQGVDGYIAVQLWWEYVNYNDRLALDTLLDYNREDVVNLRVLRTRLGVR